MPWNLEITEKRGKYHWQLILTMNPGWMIADEGKAKSREAAMEAAHASWQRKVTAVPPGEPVPWQQRSDLVEGN